MSTTTALDIISGAFRLLQVASPDVDLSAEEANSALDALNLMIESWDNESLMMYHITKESFVLTPNKNPHTIGTGGDFNTSRPTAIEAATLTVNGLDYDVKPMAYDDWAAIRLKSLATIYSEYLYLDATFPLGNVYLHPISRAASTLTIYCRKPLTEFTSLTSTFSLPKGYARAMKYGLAIELAPEYQATAGDDVKGLFIAAKAGIKRTNKRPITSRIDPALFSPKNRRFNIYKGN